MPQSQQYKTITPDNHVVLMLGQHRRQWVNSVTSLGEWHVFADVLAQNIQQAQCWISVGPAS